MKVIFFTAHETLGLLRYSRSERVCKRHINRMVAMRSILWQFLWLEWKKGRTSASVCADVNLRGSVLLKAREPERKSKGGYGRHSVYTRLPAEILGHSLRCWHITTYTVGTEHALVPVVSAQYMAEVWLKEQGQVGLCSRICKVDFQRIVQYYRVWWSVPIFLLSYFWITCLF